MQTRPPPDKCQCDRKARKHLRAVIHRLRKVEESDVRVHGSIDFACDRAIGPDDRSGKAANIDSPRPTPFPTTTVRFYSLCSPTDCLQHVLSFSLKGLRLPKNIGVLDPFNGPNAGEVHRIVRCSIVNTTAMNDRGR